MRHSPYELFDLSNLPAFADKFTGRVEFLFQLLVLGVQRIQRQDIFKRYCRYSGNAA